MFDKVHGKVLFVGNLLKDQVKDFYQSIILEFNDLSKY